MERFTANTCSGGLKMSEQLRSEHPLAHVHKIRNEFYSFLLKFIIGTDGLAHDTVFSLESVKVLFSY
jgi:hypothetical protein